MSEVPPSDFILGDATPQTFPGLVAYWNFQRTASEFPATMGETYTLHSQSGSLDVIEDAQAPLDGRALRLNRGQWLNIPRAACPQLDIHGKDGQLTVLCWMKWDPVQRAGCEFIAGQWNESHKGRQYGLFLNIGVWQTKDQVCGHLSNIGGPTPGYKYCIDGPMGATPVPRNEWVVVGMGYDGMNGYAWLNGQLDIRPGVNPYPMAGGLHDSGVNGSDFTVGAVDRSGEIGNFFCGWIAGLAVYNRALTPAEIFALSALR